MTDLISIGSSAVRNSQLALSVVSNNIANVNTDGYVRQDLDLRENLPTKNGLFFLGSGAIADGVRRAYDGQVESSLRISISDLNAQTPLIENTERLINVFGNKNASLTPALGSFFDSLRALSVDASSEVLRNQVISDGQTLSARFNGLATQLDGLDLETQQLADDKVKTLNALAEQLATVNGNLAKVSDITKQPADLLDSRDQVLRQMAAITRISVRESTNGQVNVGVGTSADQALVVDGLKSIPVGISYLAGTPSRSVLQLSPYDEPTNVTGLVGGELGGILAFRDQMLAPAMAKLDDIASTFIDEINSAHAKGMDLTESAGKALFTSAPDYTIDYSMASGGSTVTVAVEQESAANLRSLNLAYDPVTARWMAEDVQSGMRSFSAGVPAQVKINGVAITISGAGQSGDIISLAGELRPSRSISMAIDDPKALAAGDLFRVSKSVANISEASATIRQIENAGANGTIPALDTLLVNNINDSAALTVSTSYSLAKTIVPAGTSNLQLSMSRSASSDAELQVFTRDGRHLFGNASALTPLQRSVMLSEENGFVTGSTYSDAYLNGDPTYLNKGWSLGSTGNALIETAEDGSSVLTAEATIRGAALPSLTNTGANEMTVIAAGALQLEGFALPALNLDENASLSAEDVEIWLNGAGQALTATAINEIRIPASEISSTTGALTINGTEIVNKIPADDTFNLSIDEREFFEVLQADGSFVYTSDGEFKVSANRELVDSSGRVLQPRILLPENAVSFWIDIDGKVNAELANGDIENIGTIKTVVFPTPGKLESLGENLFKETVASGAPDEDSTTGTVLSSIGDLTALVNNINSATTDENVSLGVEARIDFDGSLILSNAQGSEAKIISLGSGSGVFTDISGDIQASIKITATRSAGDTSARSVSLTLGKAGSAADLQRLGFAATLTVPDTVSEDLIVFTTGSKGNAALSASYEKGTADPLQLRSSPFQINFTSDSVYQIKDTTTNTVLAQRTYVAGQPIEYQNLQVILDGAPKSGDVFSVDDNGDGFGSNENLLRLIDLESAKVLGNNDTLHESYLGLLNQAGSTARQAQVTQQALQVAYEQANTARDKVAGVNLDEEAANLIRFQQSYQASARLIQTANQLFDQILRL